MIPDQRRCARVGGEATCREPECKPDCLMLRDDVDPLPTPCTCGRRDGIHDMCCSCYVEGAL